MIHFCLEPLSSQALRSSLMSWGRTKVRGKKLNSCLPKRPCILDRFLHSRSFLPIWNVPGKWFNWVAKKQKHKRSPVQRYSGRLIISPSQSLTGRTNGRHGCMLSFLPSGVLRGPWNQETSYGVPSSRASRGFLHQQQPKSDFHHPVFIYISACGCYSYTDLIFYIHFGKTCLFKATSCMM